MQKIIVLLVGVSVLFSLASCKSKMKEDETTVTVTNAYGQATSDIAATTKKNDSLVGEVTSLIDDATSVAEDIVDDVLPDDRSSTTAPYAKASVLLEGERMLFCEICSVVFPNSGRSRQTISMLDA